MEETKYIIHKTNPPFPANDEYILIFYCDRDDNYTVKKGKYYNDHQDLHKYYWAYMRDVVDCIKEKVFYTVDESGKAIDGKNIHFEPDVVEIVK